MSELDGGKPVATAFISDMDGSTILTLAGELDISTVNGLRDTITTVLDRAPEHLVVDLTGVTFMDSTGIALLLQIAERLPRTELRNPTPLIRRVLEMTGLVEALPIIQP
jgi:anti-sigma B factor antagonist